MSWFEADVGPLRVPATLEKQLVKTSYKIIASTIATRIFLRVESNGGLRRPLMFPQPRRLEIG